MSRGFRADKTDMVFPDISEISASENNQNQTGASPSAASVPALLMDRFFSFLIDYLTTSPFVLFLLYATYNNGFRYWRSHPLAPENDLFLIIAGLTYVVYFSLIQSLFIAIWKATPGQFFLKLRLQFHESERFVFFRAWARQAAFWLSFPLLGIPFLSVMTNRGRRTFYDRVADVTVVTGKRDQTGFTFEREYVYWQSFMATLSLFVVFLFSSWVWKNYEQIVHRAGSFAALEKRSFFCEALNDVKFSERLSTAVALNLVSQLPDDCLDREADFVLWKRKEADSSLAYYAKSLTAQEPGKAAHYRTEACTAGKGGASDSDAGADFAERPLGCRLARTLTGKDPDYGRLYASLQDENFLTATLRYELGIELGRAAENAENFAAVERFGDTRLAKKYRLRALLMQLPEPGESAVLGSLELTSGRRPASESAIAETGENPDTSAVRERIQRLLEEM